MILHWNKLANNRQKAVLILHHHHMTHARLYRYAGCPLKNPRGDIPPIS